MKQRVIMSLVLSTGSSDPSLAHLWVEDLFLSNWEDWDYANGKLGIVDLDRVWTVYLYNNERLADIRVAAWED